MTTPFEALKQHGQSVNDLLIEFKRILDELKMMNDYSEEEKLQAVLTTHHGAINLKKDQCELLQDLIWLMLVNQDLTLKKEFDEFEQTLWKKKPQKKKLELMKKKHELIKRKFDGLDEPELMQDELDELVEIENKLKKLMQKPAEKLNDLKLFEHKCKQPEYATVFRNASNVDVDEWNAYSIDEKLAQQKLLQKFEEEQLMVIRNMQSAMDSLIESSKDVMASLSWNQLKTIHDRWSKELTELIEKERKMQMELNQLKHKHFELWSSKTEAIESAFARFADGLTDMSSNFMIISEALRSTEIVNDDVKHVIDVALATALETFLNSLNGAMGIAVKSSTIVSEKV